MLILTKEDWIDHVQKLKITLNKLKGKGLKFNIEKSFFRQNKMEYLVFWVARNGIKPINKKTKIHNKYGAACLPKRSTTVYRFNKLLPLYVAKAVTYIRAIN